MSADNETVERRLEDALAELAATTAFQDDAWDRITRRAGRRIWARWLGCGAIVVAAAAAIAFVFAIRIEDPSRVATTAPTTSPASTTTEQYGSVVNEHSAAIQAWEESCSDSDVECSFPQYAHENYMALRTLLVNFNQALDELPSPPDEIATLVDRTKGLVNDAINGIDQGLPCGQASPQAFLASSRCYDEWSEAEAEAAYMRLLPVFAAWSPYT
jgi:hypothetical protein